jgi:hypothetical protein
MTNVASLTDQREFHFIPGNSVYETFFPGNDAVLMDEVRGNVSVPRSLKNGRLLRIRPAIWNPWNEYELFRILSCGDDDDFLGGTGQHGSRHQAARQQAPGSTAAGTGQHGSRHRAARQQAPRTTKMTRRRFEDRRRSW